MAVVSGTLTGKISSTASSPTVNYSAEHVTTRSNSTATAISVKLTFSGWLNSSSSKLGTGIKLTVFARVNGGAWSSVVLKDTSVVWSGTAKHNASITISAATTANNIKIDFYISRTGSTYSGTAGTLGSASAPKSYTVAVPPCSPATYRVTYSLLGDIPAGYTAPTDGTAYEAGTAVKVKPIPTEDGYKFAGWYLNNEIVTTFKISGNTTLKGVWTATKKHMYINTEETWREAAPSVYTGFEFEEPIATYVHANGSWKSN